MNMFTLVLCVLLTYSPETTPAPSPEAALVSSISAEKLDGMAIEARGKLLTPPEIATLADAVKRKSLPVGSVQRRNAILILTRTRNADKSLISIENRVQFEVLIEGVAELSPNDAVDIIGLLRLAKAEWHGEVEQFLRSLLKKDDPVRLLSAIEELVRFGTDDQAIRSDLWAVARADVMFNPAFASPAVINPEPKGPFGALRAPSLADLRTGAAISLWMRGGGAQHLATLQTWDQGTKRAMLFGMAATIQQYHHQISNDPVKRQEFADAFKSLAADVGGVFARGDRVGGDFLAAVSAGLRTSPNPTERTTWREIIAGFCMRNNPWACELQTVTGQP